MTIAQYVTAEEYCGTDSPTIWSIQNYPFQEYPKVATTNSKLYRVGKPYHPIDDDLTKTQLALWSYQYEVTYANHMGQALVVVDSNNRKSLLPVAQNAQSLLILVKEAVGTPKDRPNYVNSRIARLIEVDAAVLNAYTNGIYIEELDVVVGLDANRNQLNHPYHACNYSELVQESLETLNLTSKEGITINLRVNDPKRQIQQDELYLYLGNSIVTVGITQLPDIDRSELPCNAVNVENPDAYLNREPCTLHITALGKDNTCSSRVISLEPLVSTDPNLRKDYLEFHNEVGLAVFLSRERAERYRSECLQGRHPLYTYRDVEIATANAKTQVDQTKLREIERLNAEIDNLKLALDKQKTRYDEAVQDCDYYKVRFNRFLQDQEQIEARRKREYEEQRAENERRASENNRKISDNKTAEAKYKSTAGIIAAAVGVITVLTPVVIKLFKWACTSAFV